MRVGILEILGSPARQPTDLPYRLLMTKQYASVTPQAVAVWSRQLGHQTFYALTTVWEIRAASCQRISILSSSPATPKTLRPSVSLSFRAKD
jgi:hypothetical protein